MGNPTHGSGKITTHGLQLSPNDIFKQELVKEANRTDYRRQYWQGYAKRVKRVFGTLSLHEFAEAKERAEANGRSVWGQIWAESCAYRKQTLLPTSEIAIQQKQLLSKLQRIEENISHLAQIGHIQNRKHGGIIAQSGDSLGNEALRQFEYLKVAVAKFENVSI
jgi:hypothetical protein